MKWLLRNAKVLQTPSDREVRVASGQDILMDGPTIAAVGPTGSLPADGVAEVMDAGGRLAMPGLINTHAHVPMVIFRGLAEDVSLEQWFNEYMWPLESNRQE